MLAELCRADLYSACQEVYHGTPAVRLKGNPWIKVKKYKGFFKGTDCLTNYRELPPLTRVSRSGKRSPLWLSWLYFVENGDKIIAAYIHLAGFPNMAAAMDAAGDFQTLFTGFLQFFSERRSLFMENTNLQLAEQSKRLAALGKTPQSHGGVANLLKVLTRTMREQGSNILTIAKVQYAVCIQAGIYIPEEFITDVLVAQDMVDAAGETPGGAP